MTDRKREEARPAPTGRITLAAGLLIAVLLLASGRAAGSPAATITINAAGATTPVDQRLLGSNLPAWLHPAILTSATFQSQTAAAGITLLRLPGGSWSNYYNWLECEQNGVCPWSWGVARPTDFINFLRDTGRPGLYTVNQNNTSKEAAALVAFFNGSVTDNTLIGVDVRGVDWGRVSDWAQLRADHGNPQPIHIKLWEVGNEIYGGTPDSGADCTPWGWETTWTCDGAEYVNGIGSGANRKEGYLEFRAAMRAVDPTILVGAVGVSEQAGWSNWGNEVIAAAGAVMDFYAIHHYGYGGLAGSITDVLALPQAVWGPMMADVEAAFDQHAGGREVPVAVTEYNLFAFEALDAADWMSRMVNALYMADNLGQMMWHGFDMANQWDMAHGLEGDNAAYGLMKGHEPFPRSPHYYPFRLWSRFGGQMLPVTSSLPAATSLSVYAGWAGLGSYTVMAINKTAAPITADITWNGLGSFTSGTADVLQAASLTDTAVTFNGVANPAPDLSDAPSQPIAGPGNPLNYTFPPYSVTLLRLSAPIDFDFQGYLPLTGR
jgi:hypothetical protein